MSQMIEIYYRMPVDTARESAWEALISSFGGKLDFREVPEGAELGGICLTFEFEDVRQADAVTEFLRRQGEHIEGPALYGPPEPVTNLEVEPGPAILSSKRPRPKPARPRRAREGD